MQESFPFKLTTTTKSVFAEQLLQVDLPSSLQPGSFETLQGGKTRNQVQGKGHGEVPRMAKPNQEEVHPVSQPRSSSVGAGRKPSPLFAPLAWGKPRVLFSRRSHPASMVPITCWPYIPGLPSQRLSSAACQVVGSRCWPPQTGSPNPPASVPPRQARLWLCSGAKPPLQRILLPPPSAWGLILSSLI